jgi:2-haloacid dehalogenase
MIGDRWNAVKALLFDVQGTATDFYSTVRDEAQRISNARHPQMDWGGFVDRWRAAYFTALKAASPSCGKWTTVHSVHRAALDRLLEQDGITDLSAGSSRGPMSCLG